MDRGKDTDTITAEIVEQSVMTRIGTYHTKPCLRKSHQPMPTKMKLVILWVGSIVLTEKTLILLMSSVRLLSLPIIGYPLTDTHLRTAERE